MQPQCLFELGARGFRNSAHLGTKFIKLPVHITVALVENYNVVHVM